MSKEELEKVIREIYRLWQYDINEVDEDIDLILNTVIGKIGE